MLSYLKCIKSVKGMNDQCREEAKGYLACRMEKGLMKEEEMTVLGFQEPERDIITRSSLSMALDKKSSGDDITSTAREG
jgi:cytochrome c oxidase assembly protein subunit 19